MFGITNKRALLSGEDSEWCVNEAFRNDDTSADVSRSQSHKTRAFRDGGASTDVSCHRGRRLQGQEEDRDPFLGSWRKATSRPSAPQRRWLQDGFYSGERDLRPAHAQMHAHTHTHTHTRPCSYARARTLAAHYTSGGPPCCVSCMTVFFLDYSLMNSGIGTVPTYTSCIRME